uniref:NADH-quinone oxidoreductase subunit H n=1 Tax=Heterorhabditis bacteriophora TaxID=37862 RepID=A0A1I7XRK6_HETBA
MAMKANVLGGDIYINFIFSAGVEIPALIIVYMLIDRRNGANVVIRVMAGRPPSNWFGCHSTINAWYPTIATVIEALDYEVS